MSMCWASVLFRHRPASFLHSFVFIACVPLWGVVGGACDAIHQLFGALHLLHSSKWTDRFTGRPQAWPCATGLCSSTNENWDWLKPPSVTSLCVGIYPVSNTYILCSVLLDTCLIYFEEQQGFIVCFISRKQIFKLEDWFVSFKEAKISCF